jgi:hypothetical protein
VPADTTLRVWRTAETSHPPTYGPACTGDREPTTHPCTREPCMESTSPNNEEPLSPPYWQTTLQKDSTLAEPPPAAGTIRLEDHTEETAETSKFCWAKAVRIDDFTVVGQAAAPAIGSYIVWNCTVETLSVSASRDPVIPEDSNVILSVPDVRGSPASADLSVPSNPTPAFSYHSNFVKVMWRHRRLTSSRAA